MSLHDQPPFIEFDKNEIQLFEDTKDVFLRTFSSFSFFIEKIKEQLNKILQFIENLKHDFII
jgi:hypothetical protein